MEDTTVRTLALMGLVAIVALSATTAAAQCSISGHVTGEPNPGDGPAWMYTLEVTWDNDARYGLSHFNFFVDEADGSCGCHDLAQNLIFMNPAGEGPGESGSCTVTYDGSIECNGDPSIPGQFGKFMKFEPWEDGCEPGPVGTATVVFYSDYSPAPITEQFLGMVEKFGRNSCTGLATGVFPGLPCDPVDTVKRSWGSLKGLYSE